MNSETRYIKVSWFHSVPPGEWQDSMFTSYGQLLNGFSEDSLSCPVSLNYEESKYALSVTFKFLFFHFILQQEMCHVNFFCR
jgi:hypothetical protein